MRPSAVALQHARQHARRAWPAESCGLLLRTGSGAVVYRPQRNLAGDPQVRFRMSNRVLRQALDSGTVVALVHSHPDGSGPSEADRRAQHATGVPWLVLPLTRQTVMEPVAIDPDGVLDGFAPVAARDRAAVATLLARVGG